MKVFAKKYISMFLTQVAHKPGSFALEWTGKLGRAGTFLATMSATVLTPPWRFRRIVYWIHFIGFHSLGVVFLTGLFTGMVLSLQSYSALSRFGSEAFLGPLVGLSMVREMGPVLSALIVTGRAGSAIAAEIAVMRNSEQLDAMELMAVNPFRILIAPILIATLIALPLLGAFFNVVGIGGGYLVGVELLGVSGGTYFAEMAARMQMSDILGGLYKSVTFGALLAWISAYMGYYTELGAIGVSRATTKAVVVTSVVILMWDYVMTAIVF